MQVTNCDWRMTRKGKTQGRKSVRGEIPRTARDDSAVPTCRNSSCVSDPWKFREGEQGLATGSLGSGREGRGGGKKNGRWRATRPERH